MRNARGFTLIELMIVVAIIGILAGLAMSNLAMFACRSKTTEARTNLKHIAAAEEAYRTEHGTYTAVLSDLSVNLNGNGRYDIRISIATQTEFEAQAMGIPDKMTGDLWSIDSDVNPTWILVTDNCR